MDSARGPNSQVVVNLKASEAVALGRVVDELLEDDAVDGCRSFNRDAAKALEKIQAAADRAQIPWQERT